MKKLFIFMFYFLSPTIFAATLSVPFENVIMQSNDVIQANYNFGVFSTIFCFSNNTQTVGIITWPYAGQMMSGSLPIVLKTNPIFSGSFADPMGTITITNNQPDFQIISCLFAY